MNWYKKAQVNKFNPETIKKTHDDFIAKSQNTNPNATNFAVDTRLRPKAISQPTKRKINNAIHALGNYHESIPLDQIFTICEQNGVIVLQEDGTKWSGMLIGGAECGSDKARDQRANFDLAVKLENGTYNPTNNRLSMTWCKMTSGKYEIVAYVS